MDGVIEGFFFLVKTKQEARKILIFMNENDNKLKKDIFASSSSSIQILIQI